VISDGTWLLGLQVPRIAGDACLPAIAVCSECRMSEAALSAEAAAADRSDPLREYRGKFALPVGADGQPLCYLCGHSLGLAPKSARGRLEEALADWEQLGVLGHEQGRAPWIDYAEPLREPLALLCGAQPDEVWR